MPESRPRKKTAYTPPVSKRAPGKRMANRWAAPAMLTCWLIGLVWIVVYYAAGNRLPVMQDLNGWNIMIGMALLALGFVFATKWE